MTENWLYDVEGVQNRSDKTIVKIHSQCPELLLAPEVASPELVKHLDLILSFGYTRTILLQILGDAS